MAHRSARRSARLVAALFAAAAPATLAMAQATGRSVFVLNNVSDEITALAMAPDGTLSIIGTTPTSDGPQCAAISPDGRHLAVGHGTISETTESFRVYTVAADGGLALLLEALVPDSPLDCTWLTDDVLAVTDTSVGGANFVRTYLLDAATPALLPVDVEPTGSFNAYLERHPTLPILFAQDSFDNAVRWFAHAGGGALDLLDVQSTGALFPLRMRFDGTGSFLYSGCGISGGGSNILGWEFDVDEGLLPLGGSPFQSPGASPANLAADAAGAFLFVGHGTDATVRTFAIQPDGALVPTGFSFDVGLQGTIGDLEVLAGHLLVTDESTAIDGIAGIYSFRIEANGDLTPVAPILPTGGVRPETIVVWDPPLPADLDGDGIVGFADLVLLLGAWGDCPPPKGGCPADLDGDGAVGFGDLLILLGTWT